jgi:CRP-like cAMP-binding protein
VRLVRTDWGGSDRDARGASPLRIVGFAPGRRPTDEVSHPGLGSSDCAAVRTCGDPDTNRAYVLFDLGAVNGDVAVEASIRITAPGRTTGGVLLPGWDRRPVGLTTQPPARTHQLQFHPERDIGAEHCGFANAFMRRAIVSLRATRNGVVVGGDETFLDVCDIAQLGSLYSRVIERVLVPDTARQAAAARVPDPGAAYHPWFPVLTIGGDKAALYTAALVGDIVAKERHLTDPAWLLRVGVYLELLTCLGIFNAVRDDIGDALSADERAAFEHGEAFDEVRARVDSDGWRRVWETRKIAFPRLGVPRTGPVSALNLIHKKRATLAFLHMHHDDLKHAIELAGANHHNAQETWQRVFRDAERAVLRKTTEAFPELAQLPTPMREAVLWRQHGIAGQQGLYATACTQYRDSMNAVADWAKQRGLMDHTGQECVPRRASLLDARMNNPERVAVLQRGDGYGEVIDLALPGGGTARPVDREPSTADFEALLADVPILRMLSPAELRALALTARPLLTMAEERIVVQGSDGDSLYVVADGLVEVVLRRDGVDTPVDTMGRGAVFGEMALLTGERRAATVRAVDTALIFEIGRLQYEPLLQQHPEWLDELAEIMEDRLRRRGIRLAAHDRAAGDLSIRERIRQRFFGFSR